MRPGAAWHLGTVFARKNGNREDEVPSGTYNYCPSDRHMSVRAIRLHDSRQIAINVCNVVRPVLLRSYQVNSRLPVLVMYELNT